MCTEVILLHGAFSTLPCGQIGHLHTPISIVHYLMPHSAILHQIFK